MVRSFERVALATPPAMILFGALAFAACSSSSSGGIFDQDGSTSGGDSGASNPCGPDGVYGAFQIYGTLDGTESICGLSLGSFDGGTLTIAQGSDAGATVTVTGSGAGHIDVADCAATVDTSCNVTTSSCSGSTDTTASVMLQVSVTPTTISGSSQVGYNSCQAPGLSFNGTR